MVVRDPSKQVCIARDPASRARDAATVVGDRRAVANCARDAARRSATDGSLASARYGIAGAWPCHRSHRNRPNYDVTGSAVPSSRV
jgi:hypothetical protein